ncbi:MAG: DUF2723 domain-containing protein [Chlorobiales bacterium]|nr:DUF2723 domain-containing protein [Chlorobiales bacterium]
MEHRTIHRGIALALFLLIEAVYLMTMAPTLSFWDSGEFIATAYTLGVPHPPGAPLFLLVGRLFSMIPFFEDIGARVNLLSTLSASATVMLTYLIIFRLIVMYRKSGPDSWDVPEKLSAYGGAVVGALAIAFSDSFWFNAVETEVYAPSLFFTALVIWFILIWYEKVPQEGNERWLMAAMYVIGLSIGVHLLSLLAIFAVIMMYYYKKYEVTAASFLLMIVAASAAFLLVYIGIIKGLPVLMQHASWWGVAILLGGIVYAVYYAHVRRYRLMHTISMSLLLLILGYTSYALIYVRANASPSINENNPSTGEAFFSYLNREQYGDFPLWPRRWSQEPVHQYVYQQYGSELDYFFRYQLDHMYLRYLGWQFIGRENDTEGAGVDWSQLWGIPFLVGIFGAFSHLRRDWKMATVVTALFILTGAALVVYLNQIQPQPRERDYSYTGSFFAFAVWIGIGVESFYALMRERLKHSRAVLIQQWIIGFVTVIVFLIIAAIMAAASLYFNWHPLYVDFVVIAIAVFFVIGIEIIWYIVRQLFKFSEKNQPLIVSVFIVTAALFLLNGRMLYANYHTHDRSGNYFPWDWAWNMLQSCEEDAILFTNGDNDTFPLWYLQEVEGIRTDVRVVNLSLANTGWYLDQLKNTSPNGAKKIAFSLSDKELREIGYVAIQPVEVELPAGSTKEELVKDYEAAGLDVPAGLVDTLRWRVMPTITYRGQGFLKPQDVAVHQILVNNYATRPIYFAITVGSENMLGIGDYLRLDGLAYKVVPVEHSGEGEFLGIPQLWKNLWKVFRYRNLNNPNVYMDQTSNRLTKGYKSLFTSLAVALAESPEKEITVRGGNGEVLKATGRQLALEALDKSEKLLPLERFELDPGVAALIVSLYASLGEKDKADPYILYLEGRADMTTLREAPQVYYALALALREVGRTGESEKIMDRLFEEIDEGRIELPNQ